MQRGEGSLLWATRGAVHTLEQRGELDATALGAAPAPTTWAHCVACAWAAAWLTTRGRVTRGSRELLVDERWHAELAWQERGGLRRRGHRPDLVASVEPGGPAIAVEVELAAKSRARLKAVLGLHARWVAQRRSNGVLYVCRDERVRARVTAAAAEVGLTVAEGQGARGALRVELLGRVREQAVAARAPTPSL